MVVPRLLSSRYEIVRLRYADRVTRVYEAFDLRDRRPVAVETLREVLEQDRGVVDRFRRSARAVAGVAHPRIVGIHDIIDDRDTCLVVRELADGPSLREVLTEGPLSPARATAVAAEMCDALAFAHSSGVVHGGLTPADVVIGADGTVRLDRFGVASCAGGSEGLDPLYTPPEADRRGTNERSDLFAVGCCFYEMLTGRPPFDPGAPSAATARHVHGRLQLPSGVEARLPAELVRVLHRLLAEDPDRRYRDAAAALGDLERHQGPVPEVALPATAGRAADDPRPERDAASGPMSLGRPSLIAGASLLLAAVLVLTARQVNIGADAAVDSNEPSVRDDGVEITPPSSSGDGQSDAAGDRPPESATSSTTDDEGEDEDDEDGDSDDEDEDGEDEDGEDPGDDGDGPVDGATTTSSTVATTTPESTSTTAAPAPTVPGVVGMTEGEASQALAAEGLGMDVRREPVRRSRDDGRVLSQSPGGGAPHPEDGTVTVEVGEQCGFLFC